MESTATSDDGADGATRIWGDWKDADEQEASCVRLALQFQLDSWMSGEQVGFHVHICTYIFHNLLTCVGSHT